ncbi:hypothetical protein RRV45_15260 [Bacillus sp. DTU_2020_1000418_1_SI_GHA_SEK_038]|uniref:hypothetical protein n=1 Tax=Bacillus sp. DTU_2020_1000418_1_SI_GHA_SEK_038 TaxID=3077585 RepID=UPI0028EAC6EA|nr:hypothetical protein [Bacillus sp. DTU_2020_1000418_1_SI_GHA_SEK_038]WNS74268.1 hypothetical protein RRV45_15260 [Bacillus sp. DTU_2020_1000418_1_SI_GHA_SEK_038]
MSNLKGMEMKFTVIKNEDIEKHLTDTQKIHLEYLLEEIRSGRRLDGKRNYQKYLVINTDEPYADKIIEILKRHGHWGNDLHEEHFEECVACNKKIDLETNEYKVGESLGEYWCKECVDKKQCDYCEQYVDKVRPTPFMGDIPASMCKGCWDMTKKEYAASHDEYIGDFEDYLHFQKEQPKSDGMDDYHFSRYKEGE